MMTLLSKVSCLKMPRSNFFHDLLVEILHEIQNPVELAVECGNKLRKDGREDLLQLLVEAMAGIHLTHNLNRSLEGYIELGGTLHKFGKGNYPTLQLRESGDPNDLFPLTLGRKGIHHNNTECFHVPAGGGRMPHQRHMLADVWEHGSDTDEDDVHLLGPRLLSLASIAIINRLRLLSRMHSDGVQAEMLQICLEEETPAESRNLLELRRFCRT